MRSHKVVLFLGVLTLKLMLYIPANAQGSVNLMAETRSSSSGTTCPLGTLRCRAVDVQSIVFFWYFEDESVVEYLLDEQQYPIFLSLPPRLADIATVAIVNASRSSIGASFESVLRGNLSALREAGGTSISCGSAFIRSNIISNHFSITPPPFPPFVSCSLEPVIDDSTFTILLTPMSTAEVYQVSVSPEPRSSSCPPQVRSNEIYNCPDLLLGQQYTITVNATNCGSQHGTHTFSAEANVPAAPMDLVVLPIYDQHVILKEIRLQWSRVNPPLISLTCSYDEILGYNLILRNSTGEVVIERTLTSECCAGNNCSTENCGVPLTNFDSVDNNFTLSFSSRNYFGSSNIPAPIVIAHSYQSIFNLSFASENDCFTSAMCLSRGNSGLCSIYFVNNGQTAAGLINISFNSMVTLPLLKSSTVYNVHADVLFANVNLSFQLERIFTTEKFSPRLTAINVGLISTGVSVLCLAAFVNVALIIFAGLKEKGKGPQSKVSLPLVIVFFQCLLFLSILLSVALWITVGAYVGPQRDTCNLQWQSIRDRLVIAAFVFSLLSLLESLLVAFYSVIRCTKKRKKWFTIMPIYVDQKTTKKCYSCHERFSAHFPGKKNCPGCGNVFHKKCLGARIYLPYLEDNSEVCNGCSQKGTLKAEEIKMKPTASGNGSNKQPTKSASESSSSKPGMAKSSGSKSSGSKSSNGSSSTKPSAVTTSGSSSGNPLKSSGSSSGKLPKSSGSSSGKPPKSSGSSSGKLPKSSGSSSGNSSGKPPKSSGSSSGKLPKSSGSSSGKLPKSSGSNSGKLPKSNGSISGKLPKSSGSKPEKTASQAK